MRLQVHDARGNHDTRLCYRSQDRPAHDLPTDGRRRPDSAGLGRIERRRPLTCSRWSGAVRAAWWRVKDSNLRSFRDGFTVRSHWPLGQPARARRRVARGSGSKDSGTTGRRSATGYGRHVGGRAAPSGAHRYRPHQQEHDHGSRTRRSTSSARSTARRSTTPSTRRRRSSASASTSAAPAPRSPGPARRRSPSGRDRGPGQGRARRLQGEAGQAQHLAEVARRRRAAPSGKTYKIDCKIVQGIDSDKAKAISKKIRDEGPKGVQAQIQGDQLRVTGKKKDDLQAVIALLKAGGLRHRPAVHQLPLTLRRRPRRPRAEPARRGRRRAASTERRRAPRTDRRRTGPRGRR